KKLGRGPEGFARGCLPLHWGAGAEPRIRPPTAACPEAAGRISRHAVTAKPARQGWHKRARKQALQAARALRIRSYAVWISCVFSFASFIISSGRPLATSLSG